MTLHPPEVAEEPRRFSAWIGDGLAALGLLTILPLHRPDPRSAAGARATVFFPVVGALLGVLLSGLDGSLADHLPVWATVLLLVAVWAGLSRPPETRTAAGIAVAALIVTIKIGALSELGAGRRAALLFAPVLGHWSLVVLAIGARDAARPARKFNGAITFREFALTSVLAAGAVFTLGQAAGMLVFVCAAAVVLGMRLLFHRWPGGVSWPLLRLSAGLIESVVIALFLLF